ncbi:MAG TPA: NAD(P)H-dependent oxidoreductase [Chitinophagaceae bacterium]|nr:NAD(P)H-dependent oxidoreductase [Chitinophagaceae bacterium]
MNIKIITSTTREGAQGIHVAHWLEKYLNASEKDLDIELLDLAKINLPLMNEPNHPRLQNYQHEHTKNWSNIIDSADAYIIVLGEYNYGYPAPIKNALDYLFNEWAYKPVGFVSYGGVSGGLRSTQMLKQVVTTLSMMPITPQVNIPFFSKLINEEGVFEPTDVIIKSADVMIKELKKWAINMKNMRK